MPSSGRSKPCGRPLPRRAPSGPVFWYQFRYWPACAGRVPRLLKNHSTQADNTITTGQRTCSIGGQIGSIHDHVCFWSRLYSVLQWITLPPRLSTYSRPSSASDRSIRSGMRGNSCREGPGAKDLHLCSERLLPELCWHPTREASMVQKVEARSPRTDALQDQ